MAKKTFTKSDNDVSNSFGNYFELSECAKFCLKKAETEKDNSTNWLLSYTMLSALSIEVCMKRILFENNIAFELTHNLVTLFQLLPPSVQKDVKGAYTIRRDQNIDIIDNFDDLLQEISNNFVETRYITKDLSCTGLYPEYNQLLMEIFLEIM